MNEHHTQQLADGDVVQHLTREFYEWSGCARPFLTATQRGSSRKAIAAAQLVSVVRDDGGAFRISGRTLSQRKD